MLEGLASLSLTVAFSSTLALGAYHIWADAWLNYQAEQTLYCASEGRSDCRSRLRQRLQRFLPWGAVERFELHSNSNRYQVEIQWSDSWMTWRRRRELTIAKLKANRDLRW